MKKSVSPDSSFVVKCTGRGEEAGIRVVASLFAAVLAALAIGVAFYIRTPREDFASDRAVEAIDRGLSTVTLNTLRNLNSTVEIRFYAVTGKAGRADELPAFTEGVDKLLSEFQSHGRGFIRISRHGSESDASARAAAMADGIEPLSSDKEKPEFLGITVVCGDQKVSIPRLSPEWQQALEFDLTRAILRVTRSKTASSEPVDTTKLDAIAAEQIRRSIPNLETVSFSEGYEMLQNTALEKFRDVVSSMDGQITKVQERIKEAQEEKSEGRLKSAVADLQRLQSEQTSKLQQIADDLQKQVEALKQLKKSAQ